MTNKKPKVLIPALTTAFVLVFVICGCGCKNPPAASTNPVHAVHATTSPPAPAHSLENGAYLILREASTPQDARVEGVPQMVLTYDRRKCSDAPPNEPLTYVAIDPKDYIPLIIEGAPEMKSDGQGKSILTVSLTRQNAERAEAFTRAHLGGRIAMVVGGEIVTLHKIRSVITGGKIQITRCTDNACEVIRSKLVN
jgi:preprotein translocase subunit SecD